MNWSVSQSCSCIDPPDCAPCEGSLSSITFRYNGSAHPNNQYRVEDDQGVLASGFITGDITVDSRGTGQPFIDDEIEVFVGRGDDFEDGINIETTCDEVKIGQEFEDGIITITGAVSATSGTICCNPHDTFVCISPPDCAPCAGGLTSITFRYNGTPRPNNRFRVRDGSGILANGFITGDITVNSRVLGQPFEDDELEINIGFGSDFADGFDIETTCDEIQLGQGFDDDRITIISAISAISGPLCCETEDSDNIPPEIANCPNDVELFTNSDCEAFYTWTEPTLTDNCGSAVFVEKPETNSGTFPPGETLIRYVAEDASGNEAVCQFTISVLDNANPVFTNCPSNIELLADASCNRIGEWQEPIATDNCGVSSLESNFQSGDEFPIGTTEVIYTAIDDNGNEASCQFTITIVGENLPVFSECPSNIEVATDNSCLNRIEWSEPELVDNCDIFTIDSNFKPGDSFPIGTTEVIYTAWDLAGNEAFCTFTVNVINSFEPEISECPGDISVEVFDNELIVVEWNEPILEWECSSATLQSNYQSGERFAVGDTEVVYTYNVNGESVVACAFTVTVIAKEIDFDIPKLLTINNDGINDEWNLGGIEVFEDNQVIIVDRWGGEVFKVAGYNNSDKIWRGQNKNGNLVPTGTYYYIIKAITNSGVIIKSGFLELVR